MSAPRDGLSSAAAIAILFFLAAAPAALWGRGPESQSSPKPTPAAKAAEKKEAAPLCADCHEDQAKSFPGNPHARIAGKLIPLPTVENTACQNCHGSGAKHMESSGEDKSDIRVFRGRIGADFCLTCHTSDKEHASYRTGIHASTEGVNCISCHSVHKSEAKSPHLLAKTPSALCESCHPAQSASFRNKPFAHRIGRGGMECTSCHDPHGRIAQKGLRLTRVGELPCLTCHSEKRGPFVFEHVNNVVGNCTSCHEAHGSSNPKRLIRARVDRLCLECHSTLTAGLLGSQPPSIHNISLPRWQNCTTCHTAIHGSNLSPRLFK